MTRSKNLIIIHPDHEGRILFDVFCEPGFLRSELLSDVTRFWGHEDGNKWISDARKEGLTHIASIDSMRYEEGRFDYRRPRWMTKFDFTHYHGNVWSHREFSENLASINRSRQVQDMRAWKAVDLLIEAGLTVEFSGWDESSRLIAGGVTRTSDPKVVRDYEGGYVISPRCADCGDKTGGCHCYESLEEASRQAKLHWQCNPCFFKDLYKEVLQESEPRQDVKNWIDSLVSSDEVDILEMFEMTIEQLEQADWKKLVTDHKDAFLEYVQESWADSGYEDESACECPLGV